MNDRRLLRGPSVAAVGLCALAIFAVPHARANSMPCVYYPSSGAVTDKETGLTWQATASGSMYAFDVAVLTCAALILDGNGPTSPHPWRLPTIQELSTIVHEGNHDPAIDTMTFTDGLTSFFWSSTGVTLAPGNAWGVYFSAGNTGTAAKTSPHAVRCVHDG